MGGPSTSTLGQLWGSGSPKGDGRSQPFTVKIDIRYFVVFIVSLRSFKCSLVHAKRSLYV